jgi:hypothetical protein
LLLLLLLLLPIKALIVASAASSRLFSAHHSICCCCAQTHSILVSQKMPLKHYSQVACHQTQQVLHPLASHPQATLQSSSVASRTSLQQHLQAEEETDTDTECSPAAESASATGSLPVHQ